MSTTKKLNDLKRWFDLFLTAEADYYAVMTRRCLNLMEAILSEYSDEIPSEMRERYDRVITDNGLLLLSKRIATKYVDTGKFPKIALADDLLVHGRSINRFVQTFHSLVFDALQKETKCVFEDSDLVTDTFYQSITLWVFAENDSVSLLQPELRKRLKVQNVWSESKWRYFSQYVADIIYKGDFANTSYVVSAQISDDRKRFERMISSKTYFKGWERYDKVSTDMNTRWDAKVIFLHPFSRREEWRGIYPTVRIYRRNKKFIVIPYLFSEFTVDDAEELEEYLREKVFNNRKSTINTFLDLMSCARQEKQLYTVLAQMVYLVLSAYTLSSFLGACQLEDQSVDYDTKKIARNFGNYDSEGRSISQSLEEICRAQYDENVLSELSRFLHPLKCKTESWYDDTIFHFNKNEEEKSYLELMEDSIYLQAIKHERQAQKAIRFYASGGSLPADTLDVTGERSLGQFLSNILREIQGFENRTRKYILELLYDLTHEMDIGDVSLKTRTEDYQNTIMCYSAVRNTELSLSIYPRRLRKYYISVLKIVKAFWREKDFPQWMQWYFEEVLVPHDENAKKYANDAVDFACILQQNKQIIGTLLNWNPGTSR